jgi:hypothetical protein
LATTSIVSNAFEANVRFEAPIPNFDFFEVSGVSSGPVRFEKLGSVAGELRRLEKTVFVPFTPSPNDNYVVGFLNRKPVKPEFSVDGMSAKWIGKRELKNYPSSYRSITEYLNKSKASELRRGYWSAGPHTFFPRTWHGLKELYPGSRFGLFRGPDFRYEITSEGRVFVVVDSRTHYIHAEPFLAEVRRRGSDLGWFNAEVRERRALFERKRREFRGIRFFYTLARNEAIINEVDPRPISKIPLPKPQIVNSVECRTVSEFLKERYRGTNEIQLLDETQPGVKGGEFTYAPQFLRRSASLDEIDNFILNEQSFYLDVRSPGNRKDRHKPAKERWRILNQYFDQHFRYASIGPTGIKFGNPLEFPDSNHFERPNLLTREGGPPVSFEDLPSALTAGPFMDPAISEVYLYNEMGPGENDLLNQYYGAFADCAKTRFGVRLPSTPMPLDVELGELETYFERAQTSGKLGRGSLCLSILHPNSSTYGQLLSILGKHGIPSQGSRINTVSEVCQRGRRSVLEGVVASAIAKSGGIPWVLYDQLNYSCYAAVDVGRQEAEAWAFSIVYNRRGIFATRPGAIMVGEDLDSQAIRQCVREAERYSSDRDSFILLRDGKVFPTEWALFSEATKKSSFLNCAIVSLKKDTPYRIMRKANGEVSGPLSGDYYPIDRSALVICLAGADEYEHGLAKPLRIEVMTPKGKVDLVDLAKDVFYLSYLNWGSPRHSYSMPAPVRLAHSMASDLSAGISRAGQPF